jgi:hypothetical protein
MTKPICPRCHGFIPSNERPGEYPGALSRADNKTEICSDCGTEEALVLLTPAYNWPIQLHDFPEEKVLAAIERSNEATTIIVADKSNTI